MKRNDAGSNLFMRFFLSECCVVFKLDTMGQCLVHWTPLSDLSKPLSLCFVEVTFDMDVTCNFLDKALVPEYRSPCNHPRECEKNHKSYLQTPVADS